MCSGKMTHAETLCAWYHPRRHSVKISHPGIRKSVLEFCVCMQNMSCVCYTYVHVSNGIYLYERKYFYICIFKDTFYTRKMLGCCWLYVLGSRFTKCLEDLYRFSL